MKKRLLSAVVAACLIFGASATVPQNAFTDMTSVTASAAYVQGDFEYVPSSNGKFAMVTKYKNTTSTSCTIPDKLGNMPVEVIAQDAFKGNTKLTTVTVPKSLRVISVSAFEGCTALTVVSELRNTQLTNVDKYAFKDCTAMKNINFPKTLQAFGVGAFENCTSLEAVIGLQNTKLSGQLYSTFKGCKKLTSIQFPEGVGYMYQAFQNCEALQGISLPDSITTISDYTFSGCTNLTSVKMPANLEKLGDYAFYDCKTLQGEYMLRGTKLKTVGEHCFTNCILLKKLFFPSTATDLSEFCYGFQRYKSQGSWSYWFLYDPARTIMLYNSGKAVETAYRTVNKHWYDVVEKESMKTKFEYIQCPNHNYTSQVTKKPTCTASGVETFTCTECGETYTKTLSATGHHFTETLEYVVAMSPATPVKAGYKKYKCDKCWGQLSEGYKTVTLPKTNVRIAGDSRYDTAIAVAEQFKTQKNLSKFGSVIVACGDDYADALSASYLSAAINAPILLVPKKYTAKFVDKVASYIANNTSTTSSVYVIGGEAAVDAKTFSQLKAARTGTVRLFGANRYETNKAVISKASALLKSVGKSLPSTAIVADGNNYADALSASATGVPIILVNGKSKTLPSNVKSLVTEFFSGKNLVVAGGDGAVSGGILSGLSAITSTKRVSGSDRYATSVSIANEFFKSPSAVTLATGTNYPDGLCAGLLSYATNCPLILTAKGRTSSAKSYANSKNVFNAWILGGTTLVSEQDAKTILTK